MEFEDDDDEHEEEEEGDQEDDDEEEGITIPPPPPPAAPQPSCQTHDISPSIPTNHNHNHQHTTPPTPRKPTMTTPITTTTTTVVTPRYRECLKNHAVSMGGHAVDGCGEFMPAGDEGTLEALKCAACGCHRNFHRKETDITHSTAATPQQPFQFTPSPYYRTPLPPPPPPFQVPPPPPTTTAASAHQQHQYHYRPLALPSSTTPRGDHYHHHHHHHQHREMDEFSNPSSSGGGGGGARRVTAASGSGSGKSKRFRTKFTPEQKERMFEFAERVGWRLQKHDEAAVQHFCQDVGVRRQVLKVWMHNNKNTLGGSRGRTV